MPEGFALVAAGALGAALGSFLNVCIYRLPRNLSLVRPPSTCPACGQPIAWHDNVPVLGWVWLGGRCRKCREPISVQYPLIELLNGLLWAGAAWHWGASWTALSAAVFATVLLGITITDARHYVIPHEFTIGGLVIGLGIAAVQGWAALAAALLGAGVGFALLFAIAWGAPILIKLIQKKEKEAMGGGDIWMMTMVGAFVGWKGVLLTVFLGAVLGTVIFIPIAMIARKHPHWQYAEGDAESGLPLVPFGIFLAGAAAITYLVGDSLIAWYWRTVVGG